MEIVVFCVQIKVVFYKENVRRVLITALSLINRTILIAYFPHMQKKT